MNAIAVGESKSDTKAAAGKDLTPTELVIIGIVTYAIGWVISPLLVFDIEVEALFESLLQFSIIPLVIGLCVFLKWLLAFYFGGNGGPPPPWNKLLIALCVLGLCALLSVITMKVILHIWGVPPYSIFDLGSLWGSVFGTITTFVSIIGLFVLK